MTDNNGPKRGSSTFLIDFLLGGISTAVNKAATHPIDVLSSRLTIDSDVSFRSFRAYKGLTNYVIMSIKRYGASTLWQGYSESTLRYFPVQALNFGFNDLCKKNYFNYTKDKDTYFKLFTGNIAAGAAAGVLTLTLVGPFHEAQFLLWDNTRRAKFALNETTPKYSNLRDVFKQEGIVRLYKGFGISCAETAIYRGLYFGLFDTIKPNDSFMGSLFVAYFVSLTAGLASHPIETVSRRIAMTYRSAPKYKNSILACIEIVNKEGTRSLFKGAGANVLGALGGAGTLACYDKLQRTLYGSHKK